MMRGDFQQISSTILCLPGIFLFFSMAQAQYSVYDKITGISPQFSNYMELPSPGRYFIVKLHSRYDNVLKVATEGGNVEFVRWWLGTSVDWRVSNNQSWYFELFRATEISRASSIDSSWKLNSVQNQDYFKVAHRIAFGRFPISMISYFQIHTENNRTLYNYGVGFQGTIGDFTYGFVSEYKNWSPFYQALLNNSTYDIEMLFPVLANIRQIKWSVAGEFKGIYLKSYVRTGDLTSSNRHERDYTFRPSGEVSTFMVSLQKQPIVNYQVKLSVFWEQINGDGALRYRDRKYGNISLTNSDFSETRLSLTRKFTNTFIKTGFAYQRLSGQANAKIQAWPFDNTGIDFFKAKQSINGTGNLTLMRDWVQTEFTFWNSFQMTLLAEYIYATFQSRMRIWGSALIFIDSQINQHNLDISQDFARIGFSLKLVLSKELDVNFKINQWIPLGISQDPNFRRWSGTGGTFGQIVLGFYL